MRGRSARRLGVTFVICALFVACGSGTEPEASGPPTKLVLATASSAAAETMVPLATQPVVRVTDDGGRPAPAATTVTAEVVDGTATIVAGGSVTTDAGGRAAFSRLTLGALAHVDGEVGPVTLRFSAPSLQPVTATVHLRCSMLPLAIGQTVTRTLTRGDCMGQDVGFFNRFEVTTSSPVTPMRFSVEGAFPFILAARGPNTPPLFFVGDDYPVLKVLMPAGRNQVVVAALESGVTRSYRLTAAVEQSEDINTCGLPTWWAASPITTAQRLVAGDCMDFNGFRADYLLVGVPNNATISVSMNSDAFQPYMELVDQWADTTVAWATAQGTASITFANSAEGNEIYYLYLSSYVRGTLGAYTLSVIVTNPPSAAAATAALRLPSVRLHVLRHRRDGRD